MEMEKVKQKNVKKKVDDEEEDEGEDKEEEDDEEEDDEDQEHEEKEERNDTTPDKLHLQMKGLAIKEKVVLSSCFVCWLLFVVVLVVVCFVVEEGDRRGTTR